MTLLAERPATSPPPAAPTPIQSWPYRLRRYVAEHRITAAVLLPLLALTALVRLVNLSGAPQRIDDEGTYVAQAYAVQHFGELAHYTYWYDHPPLGWLQLAGYTTLTGAFDRAPNAVLAGREAMVLAAMLSAGLLWLLARRLGMSRAAAGVALAIMALSPLAVQFQRTVYLDNVATPWALAAFVLALSPRRQLGAAAASATCFGIAVLSKETYLLLLPMLLWLLWRNTAPSTRRYGLAVAGTLFSLCGVGYLLFATVKGELLPGVDHVSLAEGVGFQLGGRDPSGSVFDPDSLTRRNIGIWLQLDVVLPAASVLAAIAGLAVRPLRPIAAGYLFLLLLMLRPGYLPVPYVVMMIPLAALLVAGTVEAAVRLRRARSGVLVRRRPLLLPAVLAAALAVGVAAPAWGGQLRGLVLADLDAPLSQAQGWISTNVPRTDRVITDDALWVDLVRDGRARRDVVWYYKLDTDPAVQALSPQGWRDYNWIVTTTSLRTFPSSFPEVQRALSASTVVATFGTGVDRVDVRRIDPTIEAGGGSAASAEVEADIAAEAQGRAVAGRALAGNPALRADPAIDALLRDGRVDARLLATLATALASGPVELLDLPAVDGEDAAGTPRRQAVLRGNDIATFYRMQSVPYDPQLLRPQGDAVLIGYPVGGGTDLLTNLESIE